MRIFPITTDKNNFLTFIAFFQEKKKPRPQRMQSFFSPSQMQMHQYYCIVPTNKATNFIPQKNHTLAKGSLFMQSANKQYMRFLFFRSFFWSTWKSLLITVFSNYYLYPVQLKSPSQPKKRKRPLLQICHFLIAATHPVTQIIINVQKIRCHADSLSFFRHDWLVVASRFVDWAIGGSHFGLH